MQVAFISTTQDTGYSFQSTKGTQVGADDREGGREGGREGVEEGKRERYMYIEREREIVVCSHVCTLCRKHQ